MKVMSATVEGLSGELVWEGSHMVRFICATHLSLPLCIVGIRELTCDLLVVCVVTVERMATYQ